MKLMSWVLLGLTALASLAGCGGGGSGGSGGGGTASLFITDDLNNGYDHVWVTIKQVSFAKTGGGTTTVFDDTAGVTVDLKTLRDADGRRFRFLCQKGQLSGSYDSVSVVLDENLVLYTTGATTGLARVFAGASGGTKTLTASLSGQSVGSGHHEVVVDFDLANWTDDGTAVTASIAIVSNDNSLHDPERHEHENYPGFVSGLTGTAPDQSFTLTRGNSSVTVQCSVDTTIFRSDNGTNPVLADGQHVEVRGVFDTSTNRLAATSVKIEGNSDPGSHDEVRGAASNLNSGAGTLDVTAGQCDHFLPPATVVHVATNGVTVFRSRAGTIVSQADFFADLANGDIVEAEGTFDEGSGTLVATKLKIEDGDDHGGGDHHNDAEVHGATSLANNVAGTFTVAATHFSGINVTPGTLIPVETNGSTIFKSGHTTITLADFFDVLTGTPGATVEVEGHWNGTVLVAKKCKFDND